MFYRIPFNTAFQQYISDCVFNIRPPDAEDEVWMVLSKRASQKLNRWTVQKHGVSLGSTFNSVAWLRLGINQIRHIVEHRAAEKVSAQNVLDLLEACLPEGALSFSPNNSGGNSGKRYPNQIIAFIPGIRSKEEAISGHSPCMVMELKKQPIPHLNLVTAYWVKQAKIKALSNTPL